jgi:hypothetical protein
MAAYSELRLCIRRKPRHLPTHEPKLSLWGEWRGELLQQAEPVLHAERQVSFRQVDEAITDQVTLGGGRKGVHVDREDRNNGRTQRLIESLHLRDADATGRAHHAQEREACATLEQVVEASDIVLAGLANRTGCREVVARCATLAVRYCLWIFHDLSQSVVRVCAVVGVLPCLAQDKIRVSRSSDIERPILPCATLVTACQCALEPGAQQNVIILVGKYYFVNLTTSVIMVGNEQKFTDRRDRRTGQRWQVVSV